MKITIQTVNKVLNSHRSFILFFSDCGPAGHPTIHTIQEIITYSVQDDYEWAHALCEDIDKVLDLIIGQSMTFYPNRDNRDIRREVAIIKRIQ